MHTRPRGFTLVELLVVIGIVAVLLGILVPVVGRVRASGLDTQCRANLRTLSQGVFLYADQNNRRIPAIALGSTESSWQAVTESILRLTDNALQCPSASGEVDAFAEASGKGYFSYGMNGHVMTTAWDRRIDRRVPTAELAHNNGLRRAVPIAEVILLADKGVGQDDILRSDDGFAYYPDKSAAGGGVWNIFTKHLAHGAKSTYRHGGNNAHVNVALMDGSVTSLRGLDMQLQPDFDNNGLRDDGVINGRWVFGPINWFSQPVDATCCE
jgi:prepilin-type N-terminal cleavage/methylation domain-containing protein